MNELLWIVLTVAMFFSLADWWILIAALMLEAGVDLNR